jgi:SAM-dependent methyltransferase
VRFVSHEQQPLDQTVERFHGLAQDDSIELIMHLHRYALAARAAQGQRVLDFGAGDGYGANLLAAVAQEVTALDVDAAEMDAAHQRYQAPNLTFAAGGIDALERLPPGSFDLVVCFEVLEHVAGPDQERLVAALARARAQGGLLLLSTPNKQVKDRIYEQLPSWRNPFHVRELTRDELETLLTRHLGPVTIVPQLVEVASAIGLPGAATVEVPAAAAWVNIAIAGDARVLEGSPGVQLPRRLDLLERELVRAEAQATEASSLQARSEALQARSEALRDQLASECREHDRTRATLARVRDEAMTSAAEASRLRTELDRLREDVHALKSRLAVRAALLVDRVPGIKRQLSRLGRLVVPRE